MQKLKCYMSSTHMTCKNDWIACLEKAGKMGFDGVELFGEENGLSFFNLPESRCEAIGKRAEELGICISAHPWVLWEDLPEEEMIARYARLVDRCIAIGIKEINMHLHFLATRRDGMDRVFAATDPLLDRLAQADVMLLYENVPEHGHRELGSEVADFASLFRRYGPDTNIMMNIDSGHAHIMHQIAPLAEDFGERWRYTHINDNDGLKDLHVAPGVGTLDFSAFARAAQATGYIGPLMMEYHETDIAHAMPVLEKAYAEVGYKLTKICVE